MVLTLATLAVLGWGTAAWLYLWRARHVCPVEVPTRAVLLNYAGLPESCRTLRKAPPESYSRPRGKDPALIYRRIGTAVVYQTTQTK